MRSKVLYFVVAYLLVGAELLSCVAVFRGNEEWLGMVFVFFALYWSWRTLAGPWLGAGTGVWRRR